MFQSDKADCPRRFIAMDETWVHHTKKNVLFHQDNAPVCTPVTAMAKIIELKFKLLPRAPYSLDLAPRVEDEICLKLCLNVVRLLRRVD